MACSCSYITFAGGTAPDPLDITEIYDFVKYADLGCCDTADGLTYDIGCKIIIGDGGVTETHFDLRKAGSPVTWRFGDSINGLELNLAGADRAILDDSTITTIGSVGTTGLKIVAGTSTQITSAKNLDISVFDGFVEASAGAVLELTDPKFAFVGKTTGAGVIKEMYTWAFTVLEGTTPIELCHIEVWDAGSNQKTDESTDAQGEITDQVYEANYWTNNVSTAKTPHSYRFYEYSYNTLSPTMAVSSKLAYSQQMTQDPYITKSKIDAGNIDATCT